jgi:multisubunit Na+/H+ antiporter MnhB subunit
LLIPVGGVVYLVVLILLGGFRQPDMALLGGLIPVARLKARLPGLR